MLSRSRVDDRSAARRRPVTVRCHIGARRRPVNDVDDGGGCDRRKGLVDSICASHDDVGVLDRRDDREADDDDDRAGVVAPASAGSSGSGLR